MLNLGFWMPTAAVLASAGVYGGFAFMMLAKPAELMEKYGYKSFTSTPVWAPLVSYMRTLGVVAINVVLLFLYFIVASFSAGWFSNWYVFCVFLLNASVLAAAAYRVFVEDPKSENSSEASVEAQKKNCMIFGALTGLCLLAFFFSWLWGPSDGNYVNDAVHGLPDELTLAREVSLLRKSASRFLKQHLIGHN